jgi:hypothetical protein
MFLFFSVFGGTGASFSFLEELGGFMCLRRVLYSLSHACSPVCSGCFGERVSLFVLLCWGDGFFLLRKSKLFFPRLTWYHDPAYVNLTRS